MLGRALLHSFIELYIKTVSMCINRVEQYYLLLTMSDQNVISTNLFTSENFYCKPLKPIILMNIIIFMYTPFLPPR